VKKPPDAANIRYGITNGQPSLRHPATDAFRLISTTESRLQAPLQRIFLCIFATKHLWLRADGYLLPVRGQRNRQSWTDNRPPVL